MTTISLQKKQKRAQVKVFNNEVKNHEVKNIEKYIWAFNWPLSYRIAIYYPLKSEIDLRFLHQKYPHIAYPVSEGRGFVYANEKTDFHKKSLFYEPCDLSQPCSLQEIDVFFVPGLAFDRWGGRLGRGKGFYDRVLSQSPKSLKIGVGLSQQIDSDSFLPQEETDVQMDILLTEKYILWASINRRVI